MAGGRLSSHFLYDLWNRKNLKDILPAEHLLGEQSLLKVELAGQLLCRDANCWFWSPHMGSAWSTANICLGWKCFYSSPLMLEKQCCCYHGGLFLLKTAVFREHPMLSILAADVFVISRQALALACIEVFWNCHTLGDFITVSRHYSATCVPALAAVFKGILTKYQVKRWQMFPPSKRLPRAVKKITSPFLGISWFTTPS